MKTLFKRNKIIDHTYFCRERECNYACI